MQSRTRKIIVAVGLAAVLGGGGGAFAASRATSTPPDPKAVLNDVATRLGVTESALEKALKDSASARVDAAVTAGTLTADQAAKIKARIEAATPRIGGFGFGGHGFRGGGFGHGFGASLDAAATYLGMTVADLRTALASGKTLADVAKDKGKDVTGLQDAIVADAKTKLDAAVKAGRITDAQEQQELTELKSRVADLVNGKLPAGRHGFGMGHGDGMLPGAGMTQGMWRGGGFGAPLLGRSA